MRGWWVQTNANPKCQDLSKSEFSGGGGVVVRRVVVVQTNIPEILEWGHSRNFEPKILATGMCSVSQIVQFFIILV